MILYLVLNMLGASVGVGGMGGVLRDEDAPGPQGRPQKVPVVSHRMGLRRRVRRGLLHPLHAQVLGHEPPLDHPFGARPVLVVGTCAKALFLLFWVWVMPGWWVVFLAVLVRCFNPARQISALQLTLSLSEGEGTTYSHRQGPVPPPRPIPRRGRPRSPKLRWVELHLRFEVLHISRSF